MIMKSGWPDPSPRIGSDSGSTSRDHAADDLIPRVPDE
jgi:hypothetical protein